MARAAGRELTTERAARLLAANPAIGVDSQVVGALADLWVEYSLLAEVVAQDSALGAAGLDAFAAPEREQALLFKLRGDVTPLDPETLREEAEERERHEREQREADRRGGPVQRSEAELLAERKHEEAEEMIRAQRMAAWYNAQAAYIDSMEKAARVELRADARDAVRAVVERPGDALAPRAAGREVATYRGGAVTVGEMRDFVRLQPTIEQQALAGASDADVDDIVRQVVRKELLLAAARARGVALTPAEEDSIRAARRAEIQRHVEASGLARIAGRRPSPAELDQQVDAMLRDAITRRQPLATLGRLGAHLRTLRPNEVVPAAYPEVVRRARTLGGAADTTAARPAGSAS